MSSDPAQIDYVQPSPLEERLVAYLDGELDDAEVREVEELLAADPKARQTLSALERAWTMLDKAAGDSVDESFTRTTLEMVSVKAAEDLAQQEAEIPRRRLRRWLAAAGLFVACGVAGFVAVALLSPNPNRQLLEDLPVLEDLNELQHVFNREDQDLQFLRLLHEHKLFSQGPDDDA